MFDLFRSQKQAVRLMLGAILLFVAASMVITLVPGLFSGTTVDVNNPVLVEVDGAPITAMDVQNKLRDYQMTGQIPPDSMVFLAGQTVENLITEEVLMLEADRLGLWPTDADLAERIRLQLSFVFEQGGVPAYHAFVQQKFQRSVREFEEAVRRDWIVEMRLRRMVTDNVLVSDEELRRTFKQNNDKIQIEYAKVAAQSFRDQIQPDEEKIQAYYQQNQTRYRTHEERSVKVMKIRAEDVPAPEVSDAELRAYYDRNIERFEQGERVRASHILFMTMAKTDEEIKQIEARANEVLGKVKAGEDFAALAKEYSEDPGTKDNGGDVGWIHRDGQMVPTFEQATFALQPGEVSELIRTEYGFHVIKVHEREHALVQLFDDVKEQIRTEISQQKQEEQRLQKMDQAVNVARKFGTDLESAGRELGFPVETYENFSRFSPPAALNPTPNLVTAIFSAPEGELLSEAAEEGTMLLVVSAIKPASVQELEEIRESVTEQWMTAQAAELARQRAQEILEAARAADGDLKQAAAKHGLSTQTSAFVGPNDTIADIGAAQMLGQTAFTAEPGTVGGPVTGGTDFSVYRIVAREDADLTQFYEKRDELRTQQLDAKRNEAFEVYKSIMRQRYEEEGKIERYQPQIDVLLQGLARGRG
jgi:peptidyl-prolyl cis-trans isomerase D